MWSFSKVGVLTSLLAVSLLSVSALFSGEVLSGDGVDGEEANEADAEQIVSPYALIEAVTADVVATIARHRAKIDAGGSKTDQEAGLRCFFDDIDTTLGKVIDFPWIARNVMGPYGKPASAEQRKLFAATFRTGLVSTYGRGLLSYGDQEIVVLPGGDDYKEKRKITVRQEIRGADGNYPLEYTMGLGKDAQWRIINVIINGINLGKTFRNQFVQASQKNGGDIDAVIAGWDSQAL